MGGAYYELHLSFYRIADAAARPVTTTAVAVLGAVRWYAGSARVPVPSERLFGHRFPPQRENCVVTLEDERDEGENVQERNIRSFEPLVPCGASDISRRDRAMRRPTPYRADN